MASSYPQIGDHDGDDKWNQSLERISFAFLENCETISYLHISYYLSTKNNTKRGAINQDRLHVSTVI
jgi:hypothetical protein